MDSHIKDTTDFLNKLSNLGNLPNNAILVTLDVSSFYTNIPDNQGIDACRHFLDTRPNTKKAIPFSLALRLRRICSTDAKFKHRINELKTYLLARGYNNNFLEKQFLRAANISRTNALKTNPKLLTMGSILQSIQKTLLLLVKIF